MLYSNTFILYQKAEAQASNISLTSGKCRTSTQSSKFQFYPTLHDTLTFLEHCSLNHRETQVRKPEADDIEKSTTNFYSCIWVTLRELS